MKRIKSKLDRLEAMVEELRLGLKGIQLTLAEVAQEKGEILENADSTYTQVIQMIKAEDFVKC